nr:MAG TPA: hypothetical protein [Caudoviricetes sp.]
MPSLTRLLKKSGNATKYCTRSQVQHTVSHFCILIRAITRFRIQAYCIYQNYKVMRQ